jgi:hypothetical protein
METIVVIQFLVIAVMGAGLSSSRKRRAIGRLAFASIVSVWTALSFLILVSRWADFPARRELIWVLSNVWLWFFWCCAVIAVLFCETLFGPSLVAVGNGQKESPQNQS